MPDRKPDPCPHCDPTHERPESRPWGVHVSRSVDGDGQPTHLVVQPSNGAHVAQSDADWLWQLIRDYRPAPDPAVEASAERLIDDAARVVHATFCLELGLSPHGDPAATDYAAVRELARCGMLTPVSLFQERADLIRYRGALRAVLGQHVPDPDEPGSTHCMRCTDCVGDRLTHPCPTYTTAAAALATVEPQASTAGASGG
ncbi:hypothetical protein GCM10027258_62950 [Amycolatopsis stemonae]